MSPNWLEHLESQNQPDAWNDIQKALAKYQDAEGYESFVKKLEWMEDKNDISKVFLDSLKKEQLESYLLLNGFPSDDEKIKDFKKEFKILDKFTVLNWAYQLEWVNQETVVEKQETVVEKQDLTKEELELDSNIKTFSTSISSLKDNPVLKNIPRFNDLIKALSDTAKNSDSIKNWEIAKEIISFLKDWNNLQTVLETARKSWDADTYNNILNTVAFFAQGDPELAQKLNVWNETIKKENKDYNEASVIRQVQTREFFGSKLEWVKSTGGWYMLGDKEVDFTTRPPSAYIKWEKGYKLETELPRIPKEYNEKRREWQKRRDVLKKDFEREKTSFDLKESELNDFVKDFPEPRESWAEEKFQEMKNEITIIEQNLSTIHEAIVALDTEMRQVLSKIEFWDKEERESKENEKRETLRFLSSIGFDAIPQSITDSVISQLNANSWLRARLWFNGVIDLANGQLGFNSDNDITKITNKEKADFASVFNRMIGGDDDVNQKIDIKAVLGEKNPVKDPAKLSIDLENDGYKNSWIAVWKMIKNLETFAFEGLRGKK